MKTKIYDYEKILAKELKNNEFKNEFEKLEEEFALAKEIIRLRKMNKMTQKDLALRVGTSQPAIARIESGSYKNLSLSFIRRVADALGAVPEIRLKRAK